MRLCQKSPSYLYKFTGLQPNSKHRIQCKIGRHQKIFYILLRKKLMRILYLQLGLQIDYIYDCYNNKQFTFHLQHKKTKNGKRRLHNTFIYI